MTPLVRHSLDGGVAEIRLNRPETGNAMNMALMEALDDVVRAVTSDARTRVILIRGAGRNFCVGGDIKSFAQQDGAGEMISRLAERLHSAVKHLANHSAPVIVAAQGASAGAGLSLVAGADLAIAARSATFTMAYAGIGLTADGGATWFLPRIIGLRRTQELAFTGRHLSALEAEQCGLVTRVVGDEDLDSQARTLAARIASGPTAAFGGIKRLLAHQGGRTLPAQLEAELGELVSARGSRDGQEGVDAFLARRPPQFTGG